MVLKAIRLPAVARPRRLQRRGDLCLAGGASVELACPHYLCFTFHSVSHLDPMWRSTGCSSRHARTGTAILLAPWLGWSTPLDEAPDEVFAARLLGYDWPSSDLSTPAPPCDGELIVIAVPRRHAVDLRTPSVRGCWLPVASIAWNSGGGFGGVWHAQSWLRVERASRSSARSVFSLRGAPRASAPGVVTADSGFRIVP